MGGSQKSRSGSIESPRTWPPARTRCLSRLVRRWPSLMTAPATILVLTVATHAGGRIAAFCGPHKVDSYTYTVAAYKFWTPGSTAADLVPDKPAGQALLTGWCYRIWPGPPTRLTLAPIESAFLLAGAAVFGWLALRLFGPQTAVALTFFFVLAQNAYNALDTTTDGFDLNECYLSLPMLAAVFAHLTMTRPGRRGFVRGLGIGLALTIKQTAAGLLAALLIHGLIVTIGRKRWRDALVATVASAAGMAAAGLPLLASLYSRGWLWGHLHDLSERSGAHVGMMPMGLGDWHLLLSLAPALWWIALGAMAWAAGRGTRRAVPEGSRDMRTAAAQFVPIWLAAEAVILWSMTTPATHYYQQIVAPITLAAGFGISMLAQTLAPLRIRDRVAAWRWVHAGTIVLVVAAAMPLWAEVRKRAHSFSYPSEISGFQQQIETWAPGSMGLRASVLKHDAKP